MFQVKNYDTVYSNKLYPAARIPESERSNNPGKY